MKLALLGVSGRLPSEMSLYNPGGDLMEDPEGTLAFYSVGPRNAIR